MNKKLSRVIESAADEIIADMRAKGFSDDVILMAITSPRKLEAKRQEIKERQRDETMK